MCRGIYQSGVPCQDIAHMIYKILIILTGHIPYCTHILAIGCMKTAQDRYWYSISRFLIGKGEQMCLKGHMSTINTG